MAVEKDDGKAFGGRVRAAALVTGAAMVAFAAMAPVPAVGEESAPGSGAAGPVSVGRLAYDLGDLAFVPGAPYQGKSEIAAVVRYPEGPGAGGWRRAGIR